MYYVLIPSKENMKNEVKYEEQSKALHAEKSPTGRRGSLETRYMFDKREVIGTTTSRIVSYRIIENPVRSL